MQKPVTRNPKELKEVEGMMKHQEESLVADLIKQVEIKHKLLKIKAKIQSK